MAAGYGTSTADMQRAGQQVLDVDQEVQGSLSALRAQLAPLASTWRGDASTAFTALMARWDSDARALSEALRSIGTAIQGSATTYQQQEDEQSRSLSAISAALG